MIKKSSIKLVRALKRDIVCESDLGKVIFRVLGRVKPITSYCAQHVGCVKFHFLYLTGSVDRRCKTVSRAGTRGQDITLGLVAFATGAFLDQTNITRGNQGETSWRGGVRLETLLCEVAVDVAWLTERHIV